MRASPRAYAIRGSIWLMLLLAAPALSGAAFALPEEAETYVQSADQLIQKGDLRGAAIQLRNAIQKAPDDGTLRVRLGQIYLALGDPIAAEATVVAARERGVPEELTAALLAQAIYQQGDFGRLLKAVPAGNRPAKTESEVRNLRGLAHLALGEYPNAETMLHDAEKLDPSAFGPKLGLVNLYLATGNTAEADREADAALAIVPDNSQALTAKARVLAAEGDTAGALEKLNAAIERDSNNAQALLIRVGILLKQGNLDAAQKDLDKVLARAPKSVQALYLQSLTYAERGDFQKADETISKISGAFSQFAQGYYLAGMIKYRLGQWDLAEDYLTRYSARVPNVAGPHAVLAAIALRKGNTTRALDEVQKALALAPQDVEVLNLAGQIYSARGEHDKALEAIEAAGKARPDSPTLQAELALVRIDRGETTTGLDELEKILKSDPKAPGVGTALVLSALRAGDVERASAAAETLAKDEPDNILYQELLGMTRFANRDLPGAEAIFKQILDKNPDLAPARRNLAQVYLAMRRNNDARQLYEAALKRNPSDVDSMIALSEISTAEGKIDEAAKYLKSAQALSANSPAAGLRLVALFESQKNWPAALSAAQDLRSSFQQDPDVASALARAQIESGDTTRGLQTYRQAVEASPKSLPLLERYAAALYANKDYAAARDVLRRALNLAPDNDQIKLQLVGVEYKASGADAALSVARSFTASDPQNPLGEILAAQVLAENGKAAEGIDLLQKTLAQKPSSRVVAAITTLQMGAGQQDQALALLQQWLDKHPDDVALLFRMAEIHVTLKKYDLALSEFERLARERSSDAVVLNNLAWIYQRNGDPRARDAAERAYRIAPIPQIADTLGWALTQQGGADKGLTYLTEASNALPANLDVQFHLAVALDKTGKPDDARKILKKIVASDANFDSKEDAKRLLSQLGG